MWFIKLLDFLRIKRAIWIELNDGSTELTHIDKKTPFGIRAYRYPFYRIREFELLPDGTVPNSYVIRWAYYRK